jgi:hypothetical protein
MTTRSDRRGHMDPIMIEVRYGPEGRYVATLRSDVGRWSDGNTVEQAVLTWLRVHGDLVGVSLEEFTENVSKESIRVTLCRLYRLMEDRGTVVEVRLILNEIR